MTESLPKTCENVIRAYERLDFGKGLSVTVPYFLNSPRKKRFTVAVEAGKGSPEEIIAEARGRAILKRIDLDALDADALRDFLVHEKLGVDCSGFAVHVLTAFAKEMKGIKLTQRIVPGRDTWWARLLLWLRPVQNIDVMTLTSSDNAVPVALADIKPGDLVRTRGGKHVLLVEETEREQGVLTAFTYVHSSGQFGAASGFQRGRIIIRNPAQDLRDQEWQEVWQGRKPSLDGWLEQQSSNGIFRLKVLLNN